MARFKVDIRYEVQWGALEHGLFLRDCLVIGQLEQCQTRDRATLPRSLVAEVRSLTGGSIV